MTLRRMKESQTRSTLSLAGASVLSSSCTPHTPRSVQSRGHQVHFTNTRADFTYPSRTVIRGVALALALCWFLGLVGCKRGGGDGTTGAGGASDADPFTRLSNLGKSQLETGDPNRAVEYFTQALALNPTVLEAQLNLANAYLLANRTDQAIATAQKVVEVERNSAAGYYVIGCAYIRQGKAEQALKAFEQSYKLDERVTALNFQLALAHEQLGHADEAIKQLQAVLRFEPEHLAAHYRL